MPLFPLRMMKGMREMVLKLIMLAVFFAVMIAVGIYCRRHASDVNGFVLGGRSVGPWLTAFAYGTSYFSAVIFIGYAGQFGWKYGHLIPRLEKQRLAESKEYHEKKTSA